MTVNCLRVSVTDRCNLRCIYCRPLNDCDFIAHEEILTFEEIHRIVRLLSGRGITSVRLTGGEPLVRQDIDKLVSSLASIDALKDLSLTTNGVLLAEMADRLKAAGLNRVNISIDSARPEDYKRTTGVDCFAGVRQGIDKALAAGLTPLKLNAVILNRINDSQILPLAQMSVDMPIAVRFIEYCPTNRATHTGDDYVANTRIREMIEQRFGPLHASVPVVGTGPARYFRIADAAGSIGFIDGRTSIFCGRCNRLRLTSDGRVKPCLYSSADYDVKQLMRRGADDEQLLKLLDEVIKTKPRHTKLSSAAGEFCMRNIGG